MPLIVVAFWIGLYPKPFFQILEQPVNQIVYTVRGRTIPACNRRMPDPGRAVRMIRMLARARKWLPVQPKGTK